MRPEGCYKYQETFFPMITMLYKVHLLADLCLMNLGYSYFYFACCMEANRHTSACCILNMVTAESVLNKGPWKGILETHLLEATCLTTPFHDEYIHNIANSLTESLNQIQFVIYKA